MPEFDSPFTPYEGPVVRVRVHYSRAELMRRHRGGTAAPQPVDVNALIDTGAESSCVDEAIVRRLGLLSYGPGLTNAPAIGGLYATADYDCSISVLHPSGDRNHNLVAPNLVVTMLPLATLGYDALIGRDVLARCVLLYDGMAGTFRLTY